MTLRFPLLASKTWTNVSSLADVISVPSGDQATAFTLARCPVKIRAFLLFGPAGVAGGVSSGVIAGTAGGVSFLESIYHPPAPPDAAIATNPIAKARRVILLPSPRRGANALSFTSGVAASTDGAANMTGFCGRTGADADDVYTCSRGMIGLWGADASNDVGV